MLYFEIFIVLFLCFFAIFLAQKEYFRAFYDTAMHINKIYHISKKSTNLKKCVELNILLQIISNFPKLKECKCKILHKIIIKVDHFKFYFLQFFFSILFSFIISTFVLVAFFILTPVSCAYYHLSIS
ncbi:hypothetical protein EDEG_01023 [Edhazardia aedis USNM 41457]|uniref:Uncharacterized protein n=1 Tax=Edhazardia aedis (strain USNM 41457) TaxID=1003232 RepID=J9DAL7_EDHAE|nr:hypothetical protein EDEG_01023 [Edhazardia aedis USNM 41457]|eukprot:EJW04801.1 hypothetical protein EDEG_01023 [Edhazardia aedis USNM 41457]